MSPKRCCPILSLWLFLPVFSMAGPTDSIIVSGYVRDAFTRKGLAGALVTLTSENGYTIDTLRTDSGHAAGHWSRRIPRRPAALRIRAERPGYDSAETTAEMLHPARLYSFRCPDLLLTLRATRQLDEAVVQATRIKLYYKGDTIMVNASAFTMPEGSMLDGLVKSVPGCELRPNGDIYMNGKKVDYLLLNGKDFFKGDHRMMLDNLPYYTVEKLQFYNRDHELDRLSGRRQGQQDYVMDVRLKRQYSIGLLGHLQGAGGTHRRWLGQAFGLRFTDHSRITLYANLNNINESHSPGQNGQWTDNSHPQPGQTRLYSAGADVRIDDKYGRYTEEASVVFNHRRSLTETHTAAETYLPTHTAFSRRQRNAHRHGLDISGLHHLTLKKTGLVSDTRIRYSLDNGRTEDRAGQFAQSPAAYGSTSSILDSLFRAEPGSVTQMAVNRTLTHVDEYDRRFTASQQFDFRKELPWGDDVTLTVSGQWTDQSRSLTDLYQQWLNGPEPAAENQRRMQRGMNRHYDLQATLAYTLHLLSGWHITLQTGWHQRREHEADNLYRLDWTKPADELLPSVLDYARLLDPANSWSSRLLTRASESALRISYYNYDAQRERYLRFNLTLPAHYTASTENYRRSNRLSHITDRRWIFRPALLWEYNGRHWRDLYRLQYEMDMQSPDLTQKADFTDTSDPLHIHQGNPDLKPSSSHRISFLLNSRLNNNRHHLTVDAGINLLHHLVAQSIRYNPTTGAYAYRPVNVDGNWNTRSSLRYHRALDPQKRFDLDVSALFAYFRNIDLKTDEANQQPSLSRVDHYVPAVAMTLHYTYGAWNASLDGRTDWDRIHPHHAAGNAQHTVTYRCGTTLQCPLPFKLQLSTDLTLYCRRGYTDRSLNANYWVWNAQINRNLWHGRLNIGLKAYDIFRQISQTLVTINGQGRTETWNRSIPRYFMLHLQWKFNKNPKKRN